MIYSLWNYVYGPYIVDNTGLIKVKKSVSGDFGQNLGSTLGSKTKDVKGDTFVNVSTVMRGSWVNNQQQRLIIFLKKILV